MHSKFALFQGPRSSSVFESKETKEVSVGTGIKDRFEWEVQAFWENNATLKPVEHCCILVKHFQHNESVEKNQWSRPSGMGWMPFKCLWCCPQHSPASTVTYFAKQPTIRHYDKF